ncbi:PREDICTED: protein PAIR1 isoform X2 [Tarenaya hassleriana]|uniref:protein PAIR1 isoform X2 n=1 Tax=Tarenaya hassleriana TaxID=28532 RepID=UPI00053C6B02|nr:PREDICTED: protein PAIR1 isoform X2 [Tarenaya hassleriana]
MKMNINRASDLSSISVFPPHTRRSSVGSAEPQSSQQQLRSQPSQQSFSQGPPSQRGGFSQLTQSSLEEAIANDQRFNSQERDLSLKKVSCLPPISHKREDSQLGLPRSSSNLMRRWNPPNSIVEAKCQIGEDFEQRIGMIETSLNRFGMLLDSIQSDIMQANRGTKEVCLETERIRQKLILHDTSLEQLSKEQAAVKASLDGGVKSVLEQINKDPYQEKLQRIIFMLTTIPEQIETSLEKTRREICNMFTREIRAVASLKIPDPRQTATASQSMASLKIPDPRIQISTASQAKENLPEQWGLEVKKNARYTTTLNQRKPQLSRNPCYTSTGAVKTCLSPKIQVGCWKSVKPEQNTCKKRIVSNQVKSEGTRGQSKEYSVVIDSDEDIDGGFSCLLDENTKGGVQFRWDAEKETERILKTARRTKRKYGNPIVIN